MTVYNSRSFAWLVKLSKTLKFAGNCRQKRTEYINVGKY